MQHSTAVSDYQNPAECAGAAAEHLAMHLDQVSPSAAKEALLGIQAFGKVPLLTVEDRLQGLLMRLGVEEKLARDISQVWLDRASIEVWRKQAPAVPEGKVARDATEKHREERYEQLRTLWDDWKRRLGQVAMALEEVRTPDVKPLVVGFSLVQDYIIYLNSDSAARAESRRLVLIARKLAEAVAQAEVGERGQQAGSQFEALVEAAKVKAQTYAANDTNSIMGAQSAADEKDKTLSAAVYTRLDVLALIYALMQRNGLKPKVRNPELVPWLHQFAAERGQRRLGGAAGNEAWMLHLLGCRVAVTAPFWSSKLAESAPVNDACTFADFTLPLEQWPLLRAGYQGDPCREGFAFQITPVQQRNKKWGPRLDDYRPQRSDRAILRVDGHQSDDPWDELVVTWDEPGHEQTVICRRPPDSDKCHWPALTAFQERYDYEERRVCVRLLTSARMAELAEKARGMVIGGFDSLAEEELYGSAGLVRLMREAFTAQLLAVSRKATPVFWELSGMGDWGKLQTMLGLAEAGGITWLGCNREELVKLTSEYVSPYFVAPRNARDDAAFGIYWRAAQLMSACPNAQADGRRGQTGLTFVRALYIHDAELDITVRRNLPGEAAEECRARLARCSTAMLAAKALVPEGLVLRSGQKHQPWACQPSLPSVIALADFADQFASYAVAELKKGGEPVKKEDDGVIKTMLRTVGYYYHPALPFSVAVAPAISVDFAPCVTTTGAGDMNAAVVVQMLGEVP